MIAKTVLLLIVISGWEGSGVNDTVITYYTTASHCEQVKEILSDTTPRAKVDCLP